jgi:hypothetical protein
MYTLNKIKFISDLNFYVHLYILLRKKIMNFGLEKLNQKNNEIKNVAGIR